MTDHPADARCEEPGRQRGDLDALREIDDRPEVQELFARLKESLPKFEELLEECSGHWGYEDPVYRFYHHSYKVYALQRTTGKIVEALESLAPDRPPDTSSTWPCDTAGSSRRRHDCCRAAGRRCSSSTT